MFLTIRTESPKWLVVLGSTKACFSKRPDVQMFGVRHTLQACFDDIERMNNQSRNYSRTEAGKRLYERR